MIDTRQRYLFIAPSLLVLLAVIIFPLIFAIRVAFSGWDSFSPSLESVGWVNFARMLKDTRFWESMGTLYMIVAASVLLEYVLGFGLALLLWREVKGGRFFRVLFIVPMTVTPVIMTVVWRTIFHETLGPMNDVLSWFGLGPVQWLSESTPAVIAVIMVEVWQWTSFMFILMLAGLLSLPSEPYEAAQIDGAGPIRTFFHLTFPLMAPITLGALVIRIIEASKIMESVYALTSGGPGTATETAGYLIYIRGLREFQIGYTAALSITYLVIMIVGLTVMAKVLTRLMLERDEART